MPKAPLGWAGVVGVGDAVVFVGFGAALLPSLPPHAAMPKRSVTATPITSSCRLTKDPPGHPVAEPRQHTEKCVLPVNEPDHSGRFGASRLAPTCSTVETSHRSIPDATVATTLCRALRGSVADSPHPLYRRGTGRSGATHGDADIGTVRVLGGHGRCRALRRRGARVQRVGDPVAGRRARGRPGPGGPGHRGRHRRRRGRQPAGRSRHRSEPRRQGPVRRGPAADVRGRRRRVRHDGRRHQPRLPLPRQQRAGRGPSRS